MAAGAAEAELPIVVKGKNLELSPGVREYAHKKASKLRRYLDGHPAARAEMGIGHLRGVYTVEITLFLGGVILRGVGRAGELRAAVDEAVERTERQYLRFKSRLEARNQQVDRPVPPAPQAATGEEKGPAMGAGEGEGEVQPGEGHPRVVRVKRFALKPMAVDEAVDQMEMLGHDFFVFTNAATGQVNVLYRRHDGNLGLIEPEV